MKYSKTATKELSKRYKAVLVKCFLLNMAMLSFPAIANATDVPHVVDGEEVTLQSGTYSKLEIKNDGHLHLNGNGATDVYETTLRDSDSSTITGGKLTLEGSNGYKVDMNNAQLIIDDSELVIDDSNRLATVSTTIQNNSTLTLNTSALTGSLNPEDLNKSTALEANDMTINNSSVTMNGGGYGLATVDGSIQLTGTTEVTANSTNFAHDVSEHSSVIISDTAILNVNGSVNVDAYAMEEDPITEEDIITKKEVGKINLQGGTINLSGGLTADINATSGVIEFKEGGVLNGAVSATGGYETGAELKVGTGAVAELNQTSQFGKLTMTGGELKVIASDDDKNIEFFQASTISGGKVTLATPVNSDNDVDLSFADSLTISGAETIIDISGESEINGYNDPSDLSVTDATLNLHDSTNEAFDIKGEMTLTNAKTNVTNSSFMSWGGQYTQHTITEAAYNALSTEEKEAYIQNNLEITGYTDYYERLINPETNEYFSDDDTHNYSLYAMKKEYSGDVSFNGGEINLNYAEISSDRNIIIEDTDVNVTNKSYIASFSDGEGYEDDLPFHKDLTIKGTTDIEVSGNSSIFAGATSSVYGNLEEYFEDTKGDEWTFKKEIETTVPVESNANINIESGTITLKDTSSIGLIDENTGKINLTGGTVNMNDSSAIYGSLVVDGGSLNVNGTNSVKNNMDIRPDLNSSSLRYFSFTEATGDAPAIDFDSGNINLNGVLTADVDATGGTGAINFKTANAKLVGNAKGATLNFEDSHVWSNAVKSSESLNAVNVKDGASIDIGANTVSVTNVDFADNSKLTFTVAGKADGEYGKINATSINISETGTELQLVLNSAVLAKDEDQDFTILDGSITGDFETLSENARYEFVKKSDGIYTITGKATAADVVADAGGSSNNAGTATAWDNVDTSTASASEVAVSNTLATLSNNATTPEGKKAYTDALTALAPDAQPVVSVASGEATTQVMGTVGARFSGGSAPSSMQGQNGGDFTLGKTSMWAQGLYNKAKLDKAQGFDSDSTGFAMGFEVAPSDEAKFGIGYAYSNADIDGFMRQTDVDMNTAFVYGEYRPSQFYVNGVLSYGVGTYDEDKNVGGTILNSKYDVDTIGMQVMTGYDMGMFTPEAGVRYISSQQESYFDGTQTISENTSDTVTAVLGTKVKKSFVMDKGLVLTPEVKLAGTYDFVTDDAVSVVTLANGSTYSTAGENLDEFGLELGAGVTIATQGNSEISVNYEGKFRQDYQDHTGMINFKYNF